MGKSLNRFLVYTAAVLILSAGYFSYMYLLHPPSHERETFLSEMGEGIGEVTQWVFVFIYLRTAIKLIMGKGPLSRRLLPDYSAPTSMNFLQRVVVVFHK